MLKNKLIGRSLCCIWTAFRWTTKGGGTIRPAAVLFLVLGFVFLLFLLACPDVGKSPSDETWVDWGISPSLQRYLKSSEVSLLQLPAEVDSFSWLPDSIEVLVLRNSSLKVMTGGLPASLKILDLGGARDLEGLPAIAGKLSALNLERTPIGNLDRFTGVLDTLGIGSRSVERIDPPPNVRDLWVTSLAVYHSSMFVPRELKSLVFNRISTEEVFPPALIYLVLNRTRRERLDDLPKELEYLAIRFPLNLDLKAVELPYGLKTLHLEDQRRLVTIPELPPGLEILRLTSGRFRTQRPVPRSLTKLDLFPQGSLVLSVGKLSSSVKHFRGTVQQAEELLAFPEAAELYLQASSLTRLRGYRRNLVGLRFCPDAEGSRVMSLDLTEFKSLNTLDLSCNPDLVIVKGLPDSLEVLSLAYTRITTLPELPKKLRVLDLRGALVESLEELRPLENLAVLLVSPRPGLSFDGLPGGLKQLRLVEASAGSEAVWNDFGELAGIVPERFQETW